MFTSVSANILISDLGNMLTSNLVIMFIGGLVNIVTSD